MTEVNSRVGSFESKLQKEATGGERDEGLRALQTLVASLHR